MKQHVLDHGYVELVTSWGSDESIIEAARMSTNKGFQGWGGKRECGNCGGDGRFDFGPGNSLNGECSECTGTGVVEDPPGDEKLLKYLWDHSHYTPFEMAGLTIEVQAPIFVFREWHRHRTQSYNELSARYTELPNMFYVPSDYRLNLPRPNTKQAQGKEWNSADSRSVQGMIEGSCNESYGTYQELIELGVARELARTVLPVGMYSRMRASANLRNWLAFLKLRLPENAQWEIRQYADMVATLVKEKFPRVAGLAL